MREKSKFVLCGENFEVCLAGQKKRDTANRVPLAVRETQIRSGLAIAEILDVDVGAKPHVVGEVPAIVIRIFVDHDLIGSPVPAIAEGKVNGSDGEVETAEPEALSIAASNAPHMAFAESAGEVTVLPRMFEVIVRIIAARIVANPLVVGVNVRSVGMAIFVDVFWWLQDAPQAWLEQGHETERDLRRPLEREEAEPADVFPAREQEQNRSRTGRELLDVISYEPPT